MRVLLIIIFIGSFSGCGEFLKTKPSHSPSSNLSEGAGNGKVTTDLDFATVKTEILQKYCISCHESGGKKHAAFAQYNVVKLARMQILDRINGRGKIMPPQSSPSLPAELKTKLEAWIMAGAPEFKTEDPDKKPQPALLGFSEIKQKVLDKNACTTCHSQYNSYAEVRKDISKIVAEVNGNQMPFPLKKFGEVSPLPVEEKEMLTQWGLAGAPEFAGKEPGPITETPLEPTWLSLRDKVLGPKCIACHNSIGPRAPTFMESYDQLQAWFVRNPKLFDFDDPFKSHFIGSLIGRVDEDNDEFFYESMPWNNFRDDVDKNFEDVTEEEQEVILEWIRLKLPFGD